ncbi:MAG: hypothetical protein ACFFF4_17650 [Candidatus Thorarchaeota archaeon]
MIPNGIFPLLLQSPFDGSPIPEWLGAMEVILNLVYAFAVNGYLILILLGFMIYTTGLYDGLSKTLVVGGIALYIVGPTIATTLASAAGIGALSFESATATWYGLFGIYESDLVAVLLIIGDFVAAVCIVVGAILYFTPTSGDLSSRGHSLIVRALIFAPILAFLHLMPWF